MTNEEREAVRNVVSLLEAVGSPTDPIQKLAISEVERVFKQEEGGLRWKTKE